MNARTAHVLEQINRVDMERRVWKYRPDPLHIKITKMSCGEFFANYFLRPASSPPHRWTVDYGKGRKCIHGSFEECVRCYEHMTASLPEQPKSEGSYNVEYVIQFQRVHATAC